jgi:hypothetical protein
MNKKTILLLLIVAITSSGAYYWWFQPKITYNTISITERPEGERSLGGYKVQSTGNSGFCGNDEVLDSNDKHIVTLSLCEDNIHTIKKEGDWVVVITDAGRSYKKNDTTGEEIINTWYGVGGMSKVK